MGIEAFGLSMRFSQPGAYTHLRQILADDPQIYMAKSETTPGCGITGEYSDSRHFIDIQLCQNSIDRCTLALRFSLCSYNTIDLIFVNLTKKILSSLEADVWLMTSVLKQKTNYIPGDQDWLFSALPDEITAMRDYWQSLFGSKQGCVRTKDSFSFVGVKHKVTE